MFKRNAALFFLLSLTLFISSARAQNPSEIEIVFDASSSMNDANGGVKKLDVAKQALTTIAGQISSDSRVGLRIFGKTPVRENIRESCTDSQLVNPIGPFQKDQMVASVLSIQSYGMTALGYSLEQAGKDFSAAPDIKKTIILLSDGEETCGKDPLQVIEALKAQGIQFTIHAIGFDASEAAKGQLKKLAEMTSGTYREARDASELQKSLQEVAEESRLLTIQRAGGENLLAASAGTVIISSSSQEIAKMIDGQEEETGLSTGHEVVFAFKQPVLLERFAAPIFKAANWNVAQLTLMGSLEKPDSGFVPLADFRLQNTVVFGNVYQEVKIDPPQPVRYLKVVIGRRFDGGDGPYSYEWKAYGKYLSDEEFSAALKSLPVREFNVLAAENGGQFIAGAKTDFAALIDGKGDQPGQVAGMQPEQEAIFGFQGGKTAVIKKIAVPVFEQSTYNCKGIEFSVSETSPTGPYTPVGSFETTNMVFAGNPYQEYVLEKPARAKYFKVKILSTHGSYYCNLAEVRADGSVG